jgi:hypothetical protein
MIATLRMGRVIGKDSGLELEGLDKKMSGEGSSSESTF